VSFKPRCKHFPLVVFELATSVDRVPLSFVYYTELDRLHHSACLADPDVENRGAAHISDYEYPLPLLATGPGRVDLHKSDEISGHCLITDVDNVNIA
jgi:hypothetical protein